MTPVRLINHRSFCLSVLCVTLQLPEHIILQHAIWEIINILQGWFKVVLTHHYHHHRITALTDGIMDRNTEMTYSQLNITWKMK
jgi:hypothetical protein